MESTFFAGVPTGGLGLVFKTARAHDVDFESDDAPTAIKLSALDYSGRAVFGPSGRGRPCRLRILIDGFSWAFDPSGPN